MHDLVIRGGLVIDGSGAAGRVADVAVDGGIITAVGDVTGPGQEEIDARGKIVTPGFVDLHTHYDAQVMWDPILAPTAWHGVTTIVMGNCSVGFAPLRKNDRGFAVAVLEAIEEISAEVLDAGIEWDWESFPEYLDAIARRQHTVDIAAQLTHISLRAYVMGERAAANEPAGDHDIAEMKRLTEQALRSGAIGISGSRTLAHCFASGEVVPGAHGNEHELLAMAEAVAATGQGHSVQYVGNVLDLDHDIPFADRLGRTANGHLQYILSDTGWDRRIKFIEDANRDGLAFYGHLSPRGVGMVGHWRSVMHPFSEAALTRSLAELPWEQRLARLADPDFKARVIAETKAAADGFFKTFPFDRLFEVAEYPDYEPDPARDSIAAKAAASGRDPYEYAYAAMMANEGTGMLYVPIANYGPGDLSKVREMLQHRFTVPSLADGGAHSTRVCDSSGPTFMLAHWARDRKRGPQLPLEQVVKYLSRDSAFAYGLTDRGLVAQGFLADLNVIDFGKLRLPAPYLAADFPGGGLRLLQRAEGYVATIKRGVITFRHGEHCGQFPGQLVRGPQMAKTNEVA